MNTVIEEKSPKGITLKIMPDRSKFLAFGRGGETIYADESKTKLLHDIHTVVFIGKDFIIPASEVRGDFSLHKVLKGKALIVFRLSRDNNERYLFLPVHYEIDLLPMRLRKINSVAEFVKALQGGLKPQFIVITDELSKGDIVVIKNRCSNAELVVIERGKMSFEVTPTQQKDNNEIAADRRASDIVKEININMFSNNPVFLARLHLRELNLAKVNQLLFDFDLSVEDAEYILSFLNTMIARAKGNVELERNIEKICALKKSFLFYINLIKKNDAEIKKMIQECNSQTDVAAYRTLLEKVKQIHNGTEEVFSFVDYENLLFEQNERLRLLR